MIGDRSGGDDKGKKNKKKIEKVRKVKKTHTVKQLNIFFILTGPQGKMVTGRKGKMSKNGKGEKVYMVHRYGNISTI